METHPRLSSWPLHHPAAWSNSSRTLPWGPKALTEDSQVVWLWSRSSYRIHLRGHLSTGCPLVSPAVHTRACVFPGRGCHWRALHGDVLSASQLWWLPEPRAETASHMINSAAWQAVLPLLPGPLSWLQKSRECCFGDDHQALTRPLFGLVNYSCLPGQFQGISCLPSSISLETEKYWEWKVMETSMVRWMGGWFGDGPWAGAPSAGFRMSPMDSLYFLRKRDHFVHAPCTLLLR